MGREGRLPAIHPSGSRRGDPGCDPGCLPGRADAAHAKLEAALGATVRSIFGDYYRLVEGYAGDPEVRFIGSSGGVLTALAIHLLETGAASAIVHVAASAGHPLRSEAHVSRTRSDVLQAAGSRYGPAAPLVVLHDLLDQRERMLSSASRAPDRSVRNLARQDTRIDSQVVALLA